MLFSDLSAREMITYDMQNGLTAKTTGHGQGL